MLIDNFFIFGEKPIRALCKLTCSNTFMFFPLIILFFFLKFPLIIQPKRKCFFPPTVYLAFSCFLFCATIFIFFPLFLLKTQWGGFYNWYYSFYFTGKINYLKRQSRLKTNVHLTFSLLFAMLFGKFRKVFVFFFFFFGSFVFTLGTVGMRKCTSLPQRILTRRQAKKSKVYYM